MSVNTEHKATQWCGPGNEADCGGGVKHYSLTWVRLWPQSGFKCCTIVVRVCQHYMCITHPVRHLEKLSVTKHRLWVPPESAVARLEVHA